MLVKHPYTNIIHFEFDNQFELTSTMVRLQEFYESPYPEINGKYFELEKFMDMYAKDNKGRFTYFTDWAGFNVPGHIVIKFMNMYYFNMREKEVKLINKIPFNILFAPKFYIIATYRNLDYKHEYAHALYYINENYKKEIDKESVRLSPRVRESWKKKLKKWGYCDKVFMDELQAYNVGLKKPRFLKIFNKYFKDNHV